MRDRLLKGGTAQSLIARLAPPLDREVVEAGLGEMMGDDFGLGRGALGVIAQNFRRAAVQHLAAALEQAVVGGVQDQRVLETIVRAKLAETPHTWVEWAASQLLQNTPLHPLAEWGRLRFGAAEATDEGRLADLENTLRLIGAP